MSNLPSPSTPPVVTIAEKARHAKELYSEISEHRAMELLAMTNPTLSIERAQREGNRPAIDNIVKKMTATIVEAAKKAYSDPDSPDHRDYGITQEENDAIVGSGAMTQGDVDELDALSHVDNHGEVKNLLNIEALEHRAKYGGMFKSTIVKTKTSDLDIAARQEAALTAIKTSGPQGGQLRLTHSAIAILSSELDALNRVPRDDKSNTSTAIRHSLEQELTERIKEIKDKETQDSQRINELLAPRHTARPKLVTPSSATPIGTPVTPNIEEGVEITGDIDITALIAEAEKNPIEGITYTLRAIEGSASPSCKITWADASITITSKSAKGGKAIDDTVKGLLILKQASNDSNGLNIDWQEAQSRGQVAEIHAALIKYAAAEHSLSPAAKSQLSNYQSYKARLDGDATLPLVSREPLLGHASSLTSPAATSTPSGSLFGHSPNHSEYKSEDGSPVAGGTGLGSNDFLGN